MSHTYERKQTKLLVPTIFNDVLLCCIYETSNSGLLTVPRHRHRSLAVWKRKWQKSAGLKSAFRFKKSPNNPQYPNISHFSSTFRIRSQNNQLQKKFNGDYYGLVHIRMYRVCACFSRRLAKIHNSSDGCLRSLFCAWLTEPLFEVFLQHRQVSHLAGFALRPTTSSLKRGEGRWIPEVLHDHKLVSSEFWSNAID